MQTTSSSATVRKEGFSRVSQHCQLSSGCRTVTRPALVGHTLYCALALLHVALCQGSL